MTFSLVSLNALFGSNTDIMKIAFMNFLLHIIKFYD